MKNPFEELEDELRKLKIVYAESAKIGQTAPLGKLKLSKQTSRVEIAMAGLNKFFRDYLTDQRRNPSTWGVFYKHNSEKDFHKIIDTDINYTSFKHLSEQNFTLWKKHGYSGQFKVDITHKDMVKRRKIHKYELSPKDVYEIWVVDITRKIYAYHAVANATDDSLVWKCEGLSCIEFENQNK